MGNVPKLRFPEFSGEWEEKKLSNTLKIKHGKDQRTIEHSNGIYPILATSGIIGYTNTAIYKKETVLIGRKGTINKPQYMSTPFWTIDTLFYSEIHAENYVKFIYYLFQTINWLEYNEASGVPSLSAATIENIKVSIPSLPEQTKIANFLTLFDKKIEKQSEKVAALEEYKKGLMQKIFSREIRFKDEEGKDYPEWEMNKLINLLKVRDERQVPNREAPLMAFTSTGGVEEKGDRYNRDFLVKDKNKKYKRTEFNDLIYSSNNLDVGAIGRNKYGTAVISDVYEIFIAKENVTPNFLEVIIKQKNFLNKVLKYRQGALYGQYRIHADDFLSIEITLPALPEQTKIASFLSLFDRKIEKEKAKLQALREQKKGLLQQMFV